MTTAYERVLAALETAGCRVCRTGDHARAQCPAHGSRGLSLAIYSDDGRAWLTCFAGCADTDVLAALGLSVADLFDAYSGSDVATAVRRPARRRLRASAWDEEMHRLGLPTWPDVDHVATRVLYDQVAPPLAVRMARLAETDGPVHLPPDPPPYPELPEGAWP